jgi:hypothetical protein
MTATDYILIGVVTAAASFAAVYLYVWLRATRRKW